VKESISDNYIWSSSYRSVTYMHWKNSGDLQKASTIKLSG